MAYAANAPAITSPFAGLRARLAQRWAQYGLYRKTLAELSMLSTRELDDLGLDAGNLQFVARNAAGYPGYV